MQLHRFVLAWLFATVACSSAPAPVVPACVRPVPAESDAELLACLAALQPIANKIVIDGSDDDWAGVPMFTPVGPSTVTDRTLHITRVGLLPRDQDLLILIGTEGAPDTNSFSFGVGVDATGRNGQGFTVNFAQNDKSMLYVDAFSSTGVDESAEPVPVPGLEFAVRSVVEIRIPYASLIPLLPADTIAGLTSSTPRPWVRIFPYSWDSIGLKQIDTGPSAASYILSTTQLDEPLHDSASVAFGVGFPLTGQWAVEQGAFANPNDLDWYYYLMKVDYRFNQSAPGQPLTMDDQDFGWNQPVFAPQSATAISVVNNGPDFPPYDQKDIPTNALPNHVNLDLGTGRELHLFNLEQNTVTVAEGAQVTAGEQVASVGNSGYSTNPALALGGVQDTADGAMDVPLGFNDVVVGLNIGAGDPWARHLSQWGIREGYVVGPVATPAP